LEFSQQAHLRVKTDLCALAQVLAWFDQFNHVGMPHPVWLQCQLALAEGFTNAVRHAHRDYPIETAIDIEVKIQNQCLEMRIWDYGVGFDLNQTLAAMPPQIDRNAEGGRGLKLMQQMADTLSYARTPDQRNCLLIIKRYK